eukprot:CAMPEP_0204901440 /NCGR_PEP_ID=MMETSP1397-20131031/3086_1 /ASSEMBLY_ACC=CAM_ASM_000891 /TAXON_ID=49980 /ORGANISM="Climacostomum Climacostomum virens, Strain Stock W-24" /LENGTH=444 /DNA_ID=CAMNT_0052069803 /DNA_START=159 /DNA_END=1493 /DNA_ORIENTATION=-
MQVSISWKRLKSCTEDGKVGFELSTGIKSTAFYPETEAELKSWMHWLGKWCILTELQRSYSLGEKIGRGATCEVTLGTHLRTNERVAIKFITKASLSNPVIYNEVTLIRRLRHRSIIKLLEVYDCPEHIALVLEYAQGGTLLQYIQGHIRIEETLVQQFMTRLYKALVYCHNKQCVHRDLKLENILVSDPNDVLSFKIADFGLACNLEVEPLGKRCGSAGYIAPEVIYGKKQTNKIDVFSAGVICHILLSGTAPFRGSTELNVMRANAECKLDLSTKYWDHISEVGKDFVRKILARNPRLRPTAIEALQHPWLSSEYNLQNIQSIVIFDHSPIVEGKTVKLPQILSAARKITKSQSKSVRTTSPETASSSLSPPLRPTKANYARSTLRFEVEASEVDREGDLEAHNKTREMNIAELIGSLKLVNIAPRAVSQRAVTRKKYKPRT